MKYRKPESTKDYTPHESSIQNRIVKRLAYSSSMRPRQPLLPCTLRHVFLQRARASQDSVEGGYLALSWFGMRCEFVIISCCCTVVEKICAYVCCVCRVFAQLEANGNGNLQLEPCMQ